MAEKTGRGFFSVLGSIFTGIKWIFMFFFIVLIFMFGAELYPVLKDCWTCNIFTSLYDAFSIIGAKTFKYFQENIFVLISACLALWIVYETYKALEPSLTFMAPDEPNFNDDFFKKIYKKLFLTIAVIWLVILNNPRNVFSNTFELSLDFGSSISRQFLRNKIDKSKIPPECVKTSKELVYSNDGVLSDNTRDDTVCLLKEVNILRHDYMDLGIALAEYGKPALEKTIMTAIVVKIATFTIGKIIASKFSAKWFKKQEKKLEKLSKNPEKNKKQLEKLKKIIEDAQDDINSGGKKRKKFKGVGNAISRQSDNIALITGIINFIENENVRIGLSGLGLVIGLFIINMFFSFIIVEKMLFLGVSILLLPLLAACYIFEQTRNFATKGLKDTFSFAVGLVFMSVAMVMCAEINDWILGGMFSAPNDMNITRTTEAISLIKAGKIEEFNKLVGTGWYFVYVIFVIGVDALLINSADTFTSWFSDSINGSEKDLMKKFTLVQPLWQMGTSAYKTTTSVVREIKNYVKTGDMAARDNGNLIDRFFKNKREERKRRKEERARQQEQEGATDENA